MIVEYENEKNKVNKQIMETDLEKFIKCDIFTPDNISEIMASKLKKSGNLLEPSVGSGNLLKYIDFDDYNSIDVYELKNEYMNKIKKQTAINVTVFVPLVSVVTTVIVELL